MNPLQMRLHTCVLRAGIIGILGALFGSHAAAQSELPEPPRSERVRESARAGMFMPWSMAPRTNTQRSFTKAASGYDTLRGSAALDAAVDVTVYGPVAVRVGIDYGERPESGLRPSGGLRVQTLKQDKHGVDMSVGAFYRPEGFTQAEGEVEGVVAFGRQIERWLLIANLVYGQDPEGAERDGEVRLGTQYQVRSSLQMGLDSRMRFDLGSQPGKRRQMGNIKYDFVVTPALVYSLGWVCLIANAGLHGLGAQTLKTGFIGMLGIGGSL